MGDGTCAQFLKGGADEAHAARSQHGSSSRTRGGETLVPSPKRSSLPLHTGVPWPQEKHQASAAPDTGPSTQQGLLASPISEAASQPWRPKDALATYACPWAGVEDGRRSHPPAVIAGMERQARLQAPMAGAVPSSGLHSLCALGLGSRSHSRSGKQCRSALCRDNRPDEWCSFQKRR